MEVQKITPPLAFHWAARVSYPSEPWRNHALCVWSWRELRKIFPECYAAILMPDHLHVLSATLAPSEIQTRLKKLHRFLKRLTRKTATPLGWQPLSEPRAIPNWSHLATQIRYVHLNPCRKGYCKDPLEWEFSTHRDYLGATAQPWPDTANALTRMSHGVNYYGRASFHAYVSGDPSVHPAGTPPPIQAAQPAPVLNLIALARAFEVTHRLPHGATRRKSRARRQFARALLALGLPAGPAARHLGIHRSAVSRLKPLPATEIQPLLLTATDSRLLSAQGTHVNDDLKLRNPTTATRKSTSPPLPRNNAKHQTQRETPSL